ncbi:MAG TPA: hypothetical protein VN887_01070 [Candidatus Angelobacter sp.]|nr:hypothetical protein [Candidatus Angelobacter sp.]
MSSKPGGAVVFVIILLWHTAFAESVVVPSTSNPWLAGMPDGSPGRRGDVAPDESPVLVTGASIEGGGMFVFSAAGSVSRGSPLPFFGPDGETNSISHYLGAENGIADVAAPFECLVGVFLGTNQPDLNPTPQPLDFSTATNRDYLILTPTLQQPFFIGDGLTSSGSVQQVIAPDGATRLFVGTIDEYSWFNNEGSFTVQIVRVPQLSITATNQITVLLSWPAAGGYFALQQNPDLSTTNWVTLTNAPILVSGGYQASLPSSAASMFYRLVLQSF